MTKLYEKVMSVGNCMFKVNNRNIRAKCEICSKLTIEVPERRHMCRSGVFEQVNAGMTFI